VAAWALGHSGVEAPRVRGGSAGAGVVLDAAARSQDIRDALSAILTLPRFRDAATRMATDMHEEQPKASADVEDTTVVQRPKVLDQLLRCSRERERRIAVE
jgi:hypothetical protein